MQHGNVEDGVGGAGVGTGVDAVVCAGIDDEVAANLCGWPPCWCLVFRCWC